MTTPTVPRRWANVEDHLSRASDTINLVLKGKTNNTGTVTLTGSTALTTLSDPRIGVDSYIGFMPTTANAAAEKGNGTLYVSSRGKQTANLTHANNAQSDRTFIYCIIG